MKGLTFLGTDGKGPWIRQHGFEWGDESLHTLALLVDYNGQLYNGEHSWDYRQRHHVPLFKRMMAEYESPYLFEWWVSGCPEVTASRASNGQPYENIVHHHSDSDPLFAALIQLKAQKWADDQAGIGELSRLKLQPDMPPSGLRNEVVVETRLPDGPITKVDWEDAALEALAIPSGFSRMMRKL